MKPKEILKIRKSLKLTREQFAPLVGVTAGAVYSWERGKHIPKAIYIEKIEQLSNKKKMVRQSGVNLEAR